MRPAAQADGLVELVGVEQSSIMSSHGSVSYNNCVGMIDASTSHLTSMYKKAASLLVIMNRLHR